MINNIIIRLANESDVNEIYKIMLEVYNKLDDKTLYVCDDLDYVAEQIAGNGFAVAACHEGKIAAGFIFRYPKLSEDNLGRDIGLSEEELPKVVHMESAFVLPEYRGKGLQSEMLRYGESIIDKDKYNIFLATVSPKNPASYKTLEKNGYRHVLTKEKYGGLERRIYCKRV